MKANIELLELEILVNEHAHCDVSDCVTCDRIKELREKLGSRKEFRYKLIDKASNEEFFLATQREVADFLHADRSYISKVCRGLEKMKHWELEELDELI